MVGFIAEARCEESAVLLCLVDRALATQHRALPVVATRFVLMGVLWATWQLQSLGTAALCGKLDVTLRSCIMSWWTLQRARQLYSMTVWLWMMVCRERARRQVEHAE